LCTGCFERIAAGWPTPALAVSIDNGSFEYDYVAQGCNFVSSAMSGTADIAGAEQARTKADLQTRLSGGRGDAILYMGPAASLTQAQEATDLYLDFAFRAEIDRRSFIQTGNHLPPLDPVPVSPRYLEPPKSR
jgi:hypothetical protein